MNIRSATTTAVAATKAAAAVEVAARGKTLRAAISSKNNTGISNINFIGGTISENSLATSQWLLQQEKWQQQRFLHAHQ
jgi:hypothetical protein